ncbi:uncharacterized protein BO97DRAFT_5461 [Aspergillus homomorphus CBS 101889]|uniref:Uncharacterized protein n=1 Tax=Aspergillus homomorphus (strain CBS 101889) TaxID=1450537 RepID=A0A395IB06_ASPHC|nr:hypothetical protein BO97DRAFT_5461 [Aspergillus homomorphus CBS 101889]RAL17367.1 hypothetical protein BO97DRAFT_5461 [Aspergillus homomorphus CBS 101889]
MVKSSLGPLHTSGPNNSHEGKRKHKQTKQHRQPPSTNAKLQHQSRNAAVVCNPINTSTHNKNRESNRNKRKRQKQRLEGSGDGTFETCQSPLFRCPQSASRGRAVRFLHRKHDCMHESARPRPPNRLRCPCISAFRCHVGLSKRRSRRRHCRAVECSCAEGQ